MTNAKGINSLREGFAPVAAGTLAVYALVSIVSAFMTGSSVIVVAAAAILLAGPSVWLCLTQPHASVTHQVSGVSIAIFPALLLLAFEGSTLQIDMHMLFFASLAIIVGWCDWRAIVLGAAAIAVHHLGLNFIYPMAVYPEGGDLVRTILHAVVVVIEVAALVYAVVRLEAAFAASEAAVAEAETARSAAERLTAKDRAATESELARSQRIDNVTQAFRQRVSDIVRELRNDAGNMDTTSATLGQVGERSTALVADTTATSRSASVSVQSVAGAADQLSGSIREISARVSDATQIVQRATSRADSTNASVQALAAGAQKIGEVVGLIRDIAEQTNLLALNATIEAARAGESGKGFAVVASEVKALASQTAKATDAIAEQISGIQASTGEAVEAIREIAGVMGEVGSITTAIAAAVEEQGAATSEIARNVNEAANGAERVAQSLGGVEAAAREAAAAAGSVSETSKRVRGTTEKLATELERFAREVAA